MSSNDRYPIVAGSFYTADSSKLKNEVLNYLENAVSRENDAKAVISPHAGYVFSGQVAASAINQLNPDKKYENVFVIGVSHHVSLRGASIYNLGDYKIPGATIKVNRILATELVKKHDFFEYNRNAHNQEHSLEVQLPFLYYHLKQEFQIIPIIIGTNNIEIIKQIADVLKPFFNEKNAFVFSSDFSHYPDYEDAKHIDEVTAKAFISNNPEEFVKTIKLNSGKNIKNLSTSACGWTGMLTLLYMTQNKDVKYQIIDYKNSGDSKHGGKDRVVGYYAISCV
ncbi:MAG: AmmeMemoRadiSam system protein B [Bacteroidales bacterium]|nr:AmmeMemoRadiSam system protein B [Bacteroidales bacterium]